MSHHDIDKFKEQVSLKNVRQVTDGNLILFNYTDPCVYSRSWDTKYTRDARGIIFDIATGQLVARPFPKFFNLGEMPETFIANLPNEPYEVFEKVDGSLGIIYYYEDKWRMATRGSFNSEQAVKGLEILQKYNTEVLSQSMTYLVEIIYPENKIVVNYGSEEKLVLLGVYEGEDEVNLDYVSKIAYLLGMPMATRFSHTILEMVELQKTIPKDQEGFVVRFRSGLRVKIKGNEYMKLHKMISNMSPLSFYESMIDGRVNNEYVIQLPEEFRPTFEVFIEKLETSYKDIFYEIKEDVLKLPQHDINTAEGKKIVGMFTQKENNLKHPTAMFPYLLNKSDALDKYIMKQIRPTGNVLI